jgi:glycogen debranching enzyme
LTGKDSDSKGKGATGSIGKAITGFEFTFEAIELESDISKMKRDLEKRTEKINKNLSHRFL